MSENYKCPLCGGTEYIEWKEIHFGVEYEFAEPCICLKRKRQLKQMENSNLANPAGMTIRMYQQTEPWQQNVVEKAVRFVNYKPQSADDILPWFYIGGQTGSGKTHICTAICGQLIEQGRSIRYEIWPDMAADLKVKQNTPDFTKAMKRLQEVDVLYLDDVFHGDATRADVDMLWNIINGRYTGNKQTIISSEMFLGEITDRDHSLGGRIHERARGFICQIQREPNRDYRRKGGRM